MKRFTKSNITLLYILPWESMQWMRHGRWHPGIGIGTSPRNLFRARIRPRVEWARWWIPSRPPGATQSPTSIPASHRRRIRCQSPPRTAGRICSRSRRLTWRWYWWWWWWWWWWMAVPPGGAGDHSWMIILMIGSARRRLVGVCPEWWGTRMMEGEKKLMQLGNMLEWDDSEREGGRGLGWGGLVFCVCCLLSTSYVWI